MFAIIPALARLPRVFVALVTVWCLGCGAFDPLLTGLSQSGRSSMECAGEDTGVSSGSSRAGDNAGDGHQQEAAMSVPDHHGQGGYSCSCDSCYSTAPLAGLIALQAEPAPEAIPDQVPSFKSVLREPLVPPPQLLA